MTAQDAENVAEVEGLLRRTYSLLLDAIDPDKGRSAVRWLTEQQQGVLEDVNDWLLRQSDGYRCPGGQPGWGHEPHEGHCHQSP